MKRNVDLNEISDGRLYSANDMVKVECGDCAGCSACCQNMGTSVVLDPMDIWKMQRGTGRMLEKLLKKELELNVVDGIILPNLRMNGTREVCSFLNEEGRCSIHPYRPGICRLFPLGRYYEKNGFHYFLPMSYPGSKNLPDNTHELDEHQRAYRLELSQNYGIPPQSHRLRCPECSSICEEHKLSLL